MRIRLPGGRRLSVKLVQFDGTDWPWSAPAPTGWLTGGYSSVEQAVGLPALLGVLLRLGYGVGMMPQIVYQDVAGTRVRAYDSWQWDLLHDRPSAEQTPIAFRSTLTAHLAAHGKAYVRKIKVRDGERVGELLPIDPRKIDMERRGGRLVFFDRSGATAVERTQDDIIYIPGMTLNGLDPVSPITALRMSVSAGLSRQEFDWRFYENDATPRTIFKFPQSLSMEQAQEWIDAWNARHQGLSHSHEAGAIGGGADVMTLPVNMSDAQFVEATKMTGAQMAGVYGIPLAFIGLNDLALTEADRMQLVTYGFGPHYTMIDQALNADRDLFPRGAGIPRMFAEHLADALLRPDTRSRFEAYKAARQAGWLTANEIRSLENYPPKDGGDELQQTPVGGAPNTDTSKALDMLRALASAASGTDRLVLSRALERAGVDIDLELEQLLTSQG